MSAPEYAPDAGDTLEQLVNQFSDQYAFLRELIQNSLDAGTKRVDVWFEFKPFEGGDMGAMMLHVDDTGEGMNREVIDTQLTRLFSSSKENDLTKIGKFGIGFVSVFALKPEAVVVDTGRDGEYWRIYFHGKDKHFDRIVLDRPVEGTQIQVVKMVSQEEYEKVRRTSVATISYWCKHCDADIYVEGQKINEPFRLMDAQKQDLPYSFTHTVPGTEVVLAPCSDEKTFYGFYNRGLTLAEGSKEPEKEWPPGIQFKIKSRYLEHTLTRDNVMTDDNYRKAMVILKQVVDGPFRKALFEAAARGRDDRLFGYLVPRLEKLPDELNKLPLVDTLDGGRLSLRDLKTLADRQGEVFWDDRETPVSQLLRARGSPVVRWRGREAEPGLGRLLVHLVGKKGTLLRASDTYAVPGLISNLPKPQSELLEAAGRILKRAGSSYRNVFPASFNYEGSCISDYLYVLQDKPGGLLRREGEKKNWWSGLFGSTSRELVVNWDNELIQKHLELAQRRPKVAPYLLAACVTMQDGRSPEEATRMLELALTDLGVLPSR